MKRTIVCGLILFLSGLSNQNLLAEQAYLGVAVAPVSGQRSFIPEEPVIGTIAYETEKLGKAGWRFSYTKTNFEHSDLSSTKLSSHILAAETMFVYTIKRGMALIAAAGPALFSSRLEENNTGDETAYDLGLSLTASYRFSLGKSMFVSASAHYKNAAVSFADDVVDAGYQAIFANFGLFF